MERHRMNPVQRSGSRALSFLEDIGLLIVAIATVISLLGALSLMIPVAWVYLLTKQRRGYDESVVQSMLILPVAVAGMVFIVQYNVALAFALGRQLLGWKGWAAAAAGAIFVAVNPALVYYSQEARMYAMMVMLGTASMWFFVGFVKQRTWFPAIAFGLLNVAGWSMHYSYPYLIVAQGIMMVLWLGADFAEAINQRGETVVGLKVVKVDGPGVDLHASFVGTTNHRERCGFRGEGKKVDLQPGKIADHHSVEQAEGRRPAGGGRGGHHAWPFTSDIDYL